MPGAKCGRARRRAAAPLDQIWRYSATRWVAALGRRVGQGALRLRDGLASVARAGAAVGLLP